LVRARKWRANDVIRKQTGGSDNPWPLTDLPIAAAVARSADGDARTPVHGKHGQMKTTRVEPLYPTVDGRTLK